MHNVPGLLWIDSIIGEFMKHLEVRGEANSTLVIFGADHGNIAKGHCFEPAMRVPLIVHCPNMIKHGSIVDAIVGNIDISSTMLDAIGFGDEFMRAYGGGRVIDGRSMLPLIAPRHAGYNPRQEIHEIGVFCEIYSDRSLVSKNYTLIDLTRTASKEPPYQRQPWGDKIQLYKANDIEQRENLMVRAMRQEDAVAAHHLSKLTSALAAHVKDTVPKCQFKFYPKQFPTVLTNTFTDTKHKHS
jgi:arylsulfatase A-like enzyme